MEEYGANTGLEISYNADLPARSGLGSSSSFSVGLLYALNALKGRMSSKKELADEAIRIEQEVMTEAVGSQDQIWTAYGGLNRINFNKDDSYEVSPLILLGQTAGNCKALSCYFLPGSLALRLFWLKKNSQLW